LVLALQLFFKISIGIGIAILFSRSIDIGIAILLKSIANNHAPNTPHKANNN
jgi:hypothetical protein